MARTNLVNRNGIWIFRKEVDGRDVRISTGFRDLKAAERRAAEIEVGLLSQRLGWNRTTVTVGGWADEYQGSYSTRKRHPKRDRQILSHALPAWGRRLIDSISRKDCEGIPAISSVLSPLSLRAVKNEPNWAWVASPDMICRMTAAASSMGRSLLKYLKYLKYLK